MTLSLARARQTVRETLATYGAPIDVLKLNSNNQDPADPYTEGSSTFDPPVATVGRGIRHPTSEQVSMIGNDEHPEIAFVFSYLELEERFPLLAPQEWIKTDDAIGFEGNLYNVDRVKLSGKFQDYTLVVVLARTYEGRTLEGYP